MFRARLITALVLGPLLIAAIWLLPTPAIAVLVAAVSALAAWEWTHLMGVEDTKARAGLVAAFMATLPPGYLLLDVTWAAEFIFYGAVLLWGCALLWLLIFSQRNIPAPAPAIAAVIGWLLLWPCWLALVYVHGHTNWGPFWHTFLLVLVWVADTGAFFAGKAWGKHRLAPSISPGKSWEGAIVGGVAGVIAGFGLIWALQPQIPPLVLVLAWSAVIVAVSVIGDLFESMLKRQRGVKDSGGLLPGHGGILDRIDSITAAAPFLAAGLAWWQSGM
ncbi:phosphatidate cytidylyltransferase [Halorhodospira halochloris]|uniref:phosphatidate cytidylyltransferase n=1 Tax=Halorhodospira halochloris TaxID=1052 RepID=UPI001EE99B67|nr:phosphatidate cytidylyltransferase [Halorhodospira halochloris]MCG5547673.1 phosphatidate cytidylyltransferase [Halorhodospira halochloris]